MKNKKQVMVFTIEIPAFAGMTEKYSRHAELVSASDLFFGFPLSQE
jgi:hypothetical protein